MVNNVITIAEIRRIQIANGCECASLVTPSWLVVVNRLIELPCTRARQCHGGGVAHVDGGAYAPLPPSHTQVRRGGEGESEIDLPHIAGVSREASYSRRRTNPHMVGERDRKDEAGGGVVGRGDHAIMVTVKG